MACRLPSLTLRKSFPQASKSYVAQRFSLFEATWTFREFGHGVVIRLPSLTLRKCFPCSRQPFFFVFCLWVPKATFRHYSRCGFAWLGHDFFVFSGFQKQRFGIFQAAVSQWLGHKTCWGSAFSHALPKHLFLGFCLVACRLPSLTLRKSFPQASKSYVAQRFSLFEATWTFREFGHGVVIRLPSLTLRKGFPCSRQLFFFLFSGFQKQRVSAFFRLQFRTGLNAKPAGALPFRMRVPSTFFLGFAWWLAGL